MSWDKNTVNASSINMIISILELETIPYEVVNIGNVTDMGLSSAYDDDEMIPLHKIITNNAVYLERMERTDDCDFDDFIRMYMFTKANEPAKWDLEITLKDPYGDEEEDRDDIIYSDDFIEDGLY